MKIYFITGLFLLSTSIKGLSGCHHAKDHDVAVEEVFGNNRTKRQAPEIPVEEYFAQCLFSNPALQRSDSYRTIVDYTIRQSTWFEGTDTVYCSEDRLDCWLTFANYLFKSNSRLLRATMECILSFGQSRGQSVTQLHYPYGIRVTPATSSTLRVDESEYIEEIRRLVGVPDDPDDQSLSDLPFLIDFYRNDVGCSLGFCNCAGIRFPSNEVCGQKWYTKMAAHTKFGSPLRSAMVSAANTVISRAQERSRRSRSNFFNFIMWAVVFDLIPGIAQSSTTPTTTSTALSTITNTGTPTTTPTTTVPTAKPSANASYSAG